MTTTLIREAFAKSTFHGLPRVATSQSLFMRIFWIIMVGISVGLFCWHVSELAMKFNKDNIVTSSDLRGMKFQFPHIYLCHQIPASLSYFIQLNKENNSGLERLQHNIHNAQILQDQIQLQANISEYNLSKSHFFWATQSLMEFVSLVGHQSYQMVSTIGVQKKDKTVKAPRVTLQYVRDHMYCYKIVATSEEMGFTSEQVTLIVYSDTDESSEYTKFLRELNIDNEFSFGLRVYFTPPGTVPNFETQLVHIRPGYFYDIRLKMLQYKLHNRTQRPCHNDTATFINRFHPEQSDYKVDNLYRSCVDRNTQMRLVKDCGCFDFQITKGLITANIYHNYPPCFNISNYLKTGELQNNTQLIDRYKCYIRFRQKELDSDTHRLCMVYIPCVTNNYAPYWSFMKWPSENSVSNTVNTYIKNPLETRTAKNLSCPGWQSILNMRSNSVEQQEAVRGTFSEIKIRPQEFFSTVMTEVPQYPLINFWSDIGGILGLYLGVSILTFFEFVELLHNMIGTFLFVRREKKMTSKEKQANENCIPNGAHSSTSLWI